MSYIPTFLSLNSLSAPLPVELARESFLLDPGAIESFDQWLQDSPSHYNLLGDSWKVYISRDHKEQLAFSHGHLVRPLKRSGRIVRPALIREYHAPPLPPNDSWMVDEILSLVFKGDVRHRRRAELLSMARRSHNGRTIHLISNCARFDRVPSCVTYFVPGYQEDEVDWPVDFDPFHDLNLHRRVREVAMPLWKPDTFPTAVHEAAKALEDAVKAESGISKDGLPLMQEAFSCINSSNPANQKAPLVPLNNWSASDASTSNDRNEAIGYRHFFEGVPSALRNPTAHENFDAAFSQARFGNKITTVKVLCFLSLLFEKLDARPKP